MTLAKFITIDGIEGAGKSTQIELLAHYLAQQNIDYLLTREPGGTELGERIRQLLLNTPIDIAEETELLLIFAARSEHIQRKIKPALANNQWVISDRFTDASFAYQGGGRGIDWHKIAELERWLMADFQPHLSFFLDIDVPSAMTRIDKRGNKDRIEQETLAFFQRVRQAYLKRAKDDTAGRIYVIDASQSVEAMHQAITTVLTNLNSSLK